MWWCCFGFAVIGALMFIMLFVAVENAGEKGRSAKISQRPGEGSPCSEGVYVWFTQWNLFYSTVPASGPGKDSPADSAEQPQSR
ncbi:hypothetical protein SRHO_G00335160, partial [Serrasalmus rhombeus]